MAVTLWQRFKSLLQPGQPIATPQVYTGTFSDTGQNVTPTVAMTCTTVNACVQAIATEIAKLPWSVLSLRNNGRVVATDHPVHNLLRLAANSECTALMWRELMLSSACLTGNGYSLIVRDAAGRPTALHYLRPDLMQIVRMGGGEIAYIYSGAEGKQVFSSMDIFHLMWMSPDGLLGYSPISLARQAIGLAIAQETFGASYYRNASRPSGALVTDQELSADALQRIRESWEQRMRGVQQAGSVAVLEGGLKWQPISLSPEDSQWLQSREFQREEICAIFRVPPSVLGIGQKQSYASAEQANREWVSGCLSSWSARLEAEAQRKLLRADEPFSTEISFDSLLKSDLMTRFQTFSIARQFGFLSVNEIRAELGRASIGEAGDAYLQPVNMVPVSNAFGGAQVQQPLPDVEALPDEPVEDVEAQDTEERADGFKPTAGMVAEAKRGLAWRSEFGRGGTPVGIARARDIVNGRNLPLATVKRMFSFFSRHEVDKQGKGFTPGDGFPSNGRIAWALWGGDAGFSWSRKIVESAASKKNAK
jgi:HK97 family phage portal protein